MLMRLPLCNQFLPILSGFIFFDYPCYETFSRVLLPSRFLHSSHAIFSVPGFYSGSPTLWMAGIEIPAPSLCGT